MGSHADKSIFSNCARRYSSFTVSVTPLIVRTPQLFTCVLSIKMAELMFVWLRR